MNTNNTILNPFIVRITKLTYYKSNFTVLLLIGLDNIEVKIYISIVPFEYNYRTFYR